MENCYICASLIKIIKICGTCRALYFKDNLKTSLLKLRTNRSIFFVLHLSFMRTRNSNNAKTQLLTKYLLLRVKTMSWKFKDSILKCLLELTLLIRNSDLTGNKFKILKEHSERKLALWIGRFSQIDDSHLQKETFMSELSLMYQ